MKKGKNIRILVPLIAMIIMSLILFVAVRVSGESLSVHTILKYTPENPFLAAFILILFFALKSLTIIFPLTILYLVSGILFHPLIAVLVSILGLAVTITIPYWIGRYSGNDVVEEICSKYPKAGQVAAYQRKNCFFACFITRMVGFLPGDIVSIYFGACKTVYPVYLLAGVCGSLLSILTTTLLGDHLADPFSIEFLSVLLLRILVSVGAVILNYLLNRSQKNI